MKASSSLRLHRTLMRLAFAGINAFSWVFIFQFFMFFELPHQAFARVALLYALSYVVAVLATPYAARRLRGGMRRGIVYGTVLASFAFLMLGLSFVGVFGTWPILGLILFSLCFGLYRALYWVPYSVESYDLRPHRSVWLIEVAIALVPAIGGLVIGQQIVFPAWFLYAAAGLIALSLIPLSFIHDTYEKFSWGYRDTFAELFARKARLPFVRSFSGGAQSAALFFLWPIAIFLIVRSSYVSLGLVLSATLLITLVLRERIRTFLHGYIKDTSMFYAAIAMSAWVGRVFVATPVGIVLVDTYFRTGTAGSEGMDTASLDQSADGGHFVDEYTALKEMGLGLGRITVCIVAALLSAAFSISISLLASFILVACIIGVSAWLTRRVAEKERI